MTWPVYRYHYQFQFWFNADGSASREWSTYLICTPEDFMTTTDTTLPTCTYAPTQGLDKGKPCIREPRHEGPHIFDLPKLEAYMASAPPPAIDFTEAEIADAITADEARRRSEALHNAQEIWEDYALRATPHVPCPSCTGAGKLVSGSLGEICPTCEGKRVVPDLAADPIEIPDFAALRAPLTRYADALAFRAVGKMAALPPASTVPSMQDIEALRTRGRTQLRALTAGGAPPTPALPAPASTPSSFSRDEQGGIEDTVSDEEIDAIEAEITGEKP
mgnify:CR=1 FL=1